MVKPNKLSLQKEKIVGILLRGSLETNLLFSSSTKINQRKFLIFIHRDYDSWMKKNKEKRNQEKKSGKVSRQHCEAKEKAFWLFAVSNERKKWDVCLFKERLSECVNRLLFIRKRVGRVNDWLESL